MNHFHEIERMSQSANPNLAIVTKIGTSHIGILAVARISLVPNPRLLAACAPPETFSRCWFWVVRTTLPRSSATPLLAPAGVDVMLAGVSDDDEVRACDHSH